MEPVITENNKLQEISTTPSAKYMEVQAIVLSHKGCVRDNNEDNFYFDGDFMQKETVDDGALIRLNQAKDFHIFAICDGMGGLKGGEDASSIAVHEMDQINKYIPSKQVASAMKAYADRACKAVFSDGVSKGAAGREGTTLAALYLVDGKAHVGNVGDSRVYLLRENYLYQLSTDHSQVYEMMKRGELTREQMRKHPRGNVIGSYVGMDAARKPVPYLAYFECPVCKGDRFMLCSDGLSDLLMHQEMQSILSRQKDPATAVQQLVYRALEMGGKDNTTCIVVDIIGDTMPVPTPALSASLPLERS